MHYFITGTDTGVGKTYVAALWIAALRKRGIDAVGFKPICCGDRADAETLRRASGFRLTLDEINPVWLRLPAAPKVAAEHEGKPVDCDAILRGWETLTRRHELVLVEGVGGWLAPIGAKRSVADLASEIGAPVVLVARNVLGAINHALLTLESIAGRGLVRAGVIMNTLPPPGESDPHVLRANAREIAAASGVPILFEIGPGQKEIEMGVA
jgi:dethiobiotin synthetase